MKPIHWMVIAPLLIAWNVAKSTETVMTVVVAAELEQLMSVHGFAVSGIEQTGEAMARAEGDDLLLRLHLLLENFDYVIVQTPDRKVERVMILGQKTAYVPPPVIAQNSGRMPKNTASSANDIVLPTQRQGVSHLLTLSLEGANHQQIQQALLIDTGADQVVLPASLIATLGLNPNTLRERQVQTANGTIIAQAGNLPALWLGPQRLANIAVAFIDDQRLGGQALLGMSVLGRFRMTIDDANNQITLSIK